MPELPEVETVRRGLAPHVRGRRITRILVRNAGLRQPVPSDLQHRFSGALVHEIQRRGKYLLFGTDVGWMILHLGMSGVLRLVDSSQPAHKHDHVDMDLDDGRVLRFTDPRRFGLLLWTAENPLQHPLLAGLGPEPLDATFDGAYLWARARGRSLAVKSFLMDSRIVVGVGNIYASEALFRACIRPDRAAGGIGRLRYERLAQAVKAVLAEAIEAGGTTLRDFVDGEGRPGYFRVQLQVYGRRGEPCPRCGKPLAVATIGQRSSFFCRSCQR
ncbi:DNA-(apurinic or apyrimidinic site) lyase [Geoalkalibacter ferrihydriticus]|uniref:Formamidopyrimidine-DNA glycosylase n=2 Tax=Geoalkalibacter ferrihydriticus TaxID=392333 RepID=A0A0C2EDM2_9BACT|nr:bifunctional DNA-formamidopyrimidine glycosylase/DNA-(apurinic or apyrimidinic site) lyase [Geoalkalibacter ferrihydriticus]KIH76638.1 5-hydroxymethyluracil DNA glycosylase [Geoalkalibacter ferrihydriticus DSM 17813]SDM04539.1 DNA-(apurinic or apyrimidinic site) lyase [Geoalkalibacter ferrihydriticus]